MKTLTLIVPGLLWPAHSARSVAADLSLPGLTALLHRARIQQQASATAEDVLLQCAGLPPTTSRASLRALGDDIDATDILCADPVPIVFGREGLVLGEPAALDITANEAAALIASCNQHFSDIGANSQFLAPHPARWYLKTAAQNWGTHPLSDALGRRIDNYLPASPEARRLLNEIQILFHNHPVNAMRQARGAPAITGVWLWGEGQLPPPPRIVPALHADSPLARGIARWAGVPLKGTQTAPLDRQHDTLVLLDDAREPCLNLDIDRWRHALESLDARWFQPLAASGPVRLHLPGDRASLTLDCGKLPFLRRFARKQSFSDFLSTLQDE